MKNSEQTVHHKIKPLFLIFCSYSNLLFLVTISEFSTLFILHILLDVSGSVFQPDVWMEVISFSNLRLLLYYDGWVLGPMSFLYMLV